MAKPSVVQRAAAATVYRQVAAFRPACSLARRPHMCINALATAAPGVEPQASPMAPLPALSSQPAAHYYGTVVVRAIGGGAGGGAAAPSSPAVGEKRKHRGEVDAERQQEEEGQEEQELLASAFVLARYSPYFNRALAERWGGDGQQLDVPVDSLPAFKQLLEYMHSMGKVLPEGGSCQLKQKLARKRQAAMPRRAAVNGLQPVDSVVRACVHDMVCACRCCRDSAPAGRGACVRCGGLRCSHSRQPETAKVRP